MPNTTIVIGGGPIGFSQALGLKKLNPNLRIVVFEKYTEYQRHHTLNMQHQHLREWMQAAGLTESETLLALEKRLQKNVHIRTSDLENTLKKIALELGIEICYEAITQDNIATKLSDYPDTSLIIGADGTHSITNHLFFPPGNQVKYEFDYALQCRYDITEEHTHPLYSAMLQSGRLAHEYTGPRDAKTGLLASAQLLRELRPAIQNPRKRQLKNRLQQYQQWFIKDFAPQQIKAVEHYSYWRVGIARMVMEAMPPVSSQSLSNVPEDFLPIVAEHIKLRIPGA